MANLLIWGTGGHASVVADIVRCEGIHNIVGFLDSGYESPRTFNGAPVLGSESQLESIISTYSCTHAIVAIGDCGARLRLAEVLKQHNLSLATAIHPRASVSAGAKIGEGSVVEAGAVVCTGASVGKSVIINTSSSVNHDCVLGDGTHICPGSHLAGNVTVGSGTWIGIGSTIIEKINIGSNTMIGAGSVVLQDIPDNVLVFGVPAKIIRELSSAPH